MRKPKRSRSHSPKVITWRLSNNAGLYAYEISTWTKNDMEVEVSKCWETCSFITRTDHKPNINLSVDFRSNKHSDKWVFELTAGYNFADITSLRNVPGDEQDAVDQIWSESVDNFAKFGWKLKNTYYELSAPLVLTNLNTGEEFTETIN